MSGTEDQMPKQERRRPGMVNRLRRRLSEDNDKNVILDPDVFMVSIAIALLLLGALLALTLYQQHLIKQSQDQINANQAMIRHQQKSLVTLERRDRINSYQAAYRFCTRESIDRAAIHWFLERKVIVSLPKQVIKQARRQSLSDLHRMERKDGMPVLNCDPNTVGNPATYLPAAKQRAFVERWRTHQLTPAEIGICKIRIGTLVRPGACLK